MEADTELDPDTDDLPLRANTKHILVRHYVLDLTVHFDRRVISGNVVLFLEPTEAEAEGEETGGETRAGEETGERAGAGAGTHAGAGEEIRTGAGGEADGQRRPDSAGDGVEESRASGETASLHSWESRGDREDFTLVLDCCDLSVSKVEEVDITCVLGSPGCSVQTDKVTPLSSGSALAHRLMSMPSQSCRGQHQLYSQCSRAPSVQGGGQLWFCTDRWSLKVRKRGVVSPQEFPRVLRIFYETRPTGGSVRWTHDQGNRSCVYTAGSPINNRALFPCQEPPVAMSTWQALVRAPAECVVLMSGEEQAVPKQESSTGFLIWSYYVTMPMPASTLALAVGHWHQVSVVRPCGSDSDREESLDKTGDKTETGPGEGSSDVVDSVLQTDSGHRTTRSDLAFCHSSLENAEPTPTDYTGPADDGISCSHGDYPCRFTEQRAMSQRVIPHRVFAPVCLLQEAQLVLNLLPRCLAAAHSVLGVHPFPRLDVLIVPAGFSSLGMASPHIVFLSQSVLGVSEGASPMESSLCGSRLCHEIAHSWFGLVIGARDWTEEWISEGFATFLEDIIWAQAQQLSVQEAAEQSDLKALLRWRRLSDELHNSQEQLQILRPNLDSTGAVSESGSSTVKHALNPDKTFMQVHYLKGYFLLRFLASEVGEQQFIDFFRVFVKKVHGQLILSQDFLKMVLFTFPDIERKGLTLSSIYADWLDRPGIPTVVKWILPSRSHQEKGRKRKRPETKVNHKKLSSDQMVMLLELLLEEETMSHATMLRLQKVFGLQRQDAEVRHRWCELVVKHGFSQAYRDVEHFLIHDQAMGVYLYGELMVQEDARQQALARRCLTLVREEMDPSARRVVEEMVL
ncbi:aminopeptidase O isoform X2 [Boleophthalmus pectinirostris]|uniref:aminopeptidase O isoform X2 n=1 Tax=Boleophthalmus pectinirostris TaxID=150288 RepID=UPI00242E4A2F|nr:aminopeptidase O isoform X2 [Boleophthalmus pectinirostris]